MVQKGARRGTSVVAVLLACLACSGGSDAPPRGGGGGGGGGSGGGGGGGGGSDSCYLFAIGSTCALTLAPFDVQEFFFQAPGQGQTFLDISLTGSTSYTAWALEEPDGYLWPCDNFTYGVDQSCVVMVNGGAGYHLWVYEAEGNAGTTNLTIARFQTLGSIVKPVPVSPDSLVNGSVGANDTSYFSFVAERSALHTIAITGMFAQLDWELFRDAGYQDLLQACTTDAHAPDLACQAPLAAGATYYLRVRERSGAPREFQLAIGSGALDEGSPSSPVALAIGGPSRTSTVDVLGHSWFALTPEVSGVHAILLDPHSVTLDGLAYSYPADLGWTLFDDAARTHVVAECRDYRGILSYFEHCAVSLTAGVSYTLRVDERAGYPNRVYGLTAVQRTPAGGASEGAVGAPVPITFTSGWGVVAPLGSSYYSFRTGASVSSYRIIATSQRDDFYFAGSNLGWILFDDAAFSHEIARCRQAAGIVAQSCLTPALAPSATYYVRVDEHDGVAQRFGLSLYGGFPPATPSSVAAPVVVPLGPGGLAAVQDNTLSTGYYAFTTAEAGTYRIDTNIYTGGGLAHVAWTLYDDAAFSREIAHCFQSDGNRMGTSCTVSLPGGTVFRLEVRAVGAEAGDPASTINGSNDLRILVQRLGP